MFVHRIWCSQQTQESEKKMNNSPETTKKRLIEHQITDTFRAWVQDCLAALNISATSVSTELGLGRNHVSDFLRDPAKDIRLAVAHGITCKLREKAHDKGTALPRMTAGLFNV